MKFYFKKTLKDVTLVFVFSLIFSSSNGDTPSPSIMKINAANEVQ
ncbi:hypothetical protein [Flavivirga eckloniae]|nr:hypothetical protein [Flavivirga eckloniae]